MRRMCGAMGKVIKDTPHANGIDICIYTQDFENEFISLTDIARYKSEDPAAVIQNWMRNRDVIEFLGLWERLHNPDFKPLEFEGFRKEAGLNGFTLSPKKWIASTNAIPIPSSLLGNAKIEPCASFSGTSCVVPWNFTRPSSRYGGFPR